LGVEEVKAYARDLATRLLGLGQSFPKTWFLLGLSGQVFADVVFDELETALQNWDGDLNVDLNDVQIVRVSCNRESKDVKFVDAFDITKAVEHSCVLLDSAVHSGHTMLAVYNRLRDVGFTDVITYTLLLKRNAIMIPNFFGVLIEENDRCLFQLDSIPNNRLAKSPPFGVLRELSASDAKRPFLNTGTAAVDTTFSALLYEQERGSKVFVYEHQKEICGVLSFQKNGKTVFIDLIANSENYRKKGVGGAMMRWAETWARSTNCEAIELWAITDRIDFYKKRKFVELDRLLDLGDSQYRLMRRKLLYNTSMVGETA
jgi:GNAT superfamily N-acetyltransferase/pyrimidine operon attenuation protein/uracil phosphoribosyltransferase